MPVAPIVSDWSSVYLSADITGGHDSPSHITDRATLSLGNKNAAKYWAPYLEEHDRAPRSNA